MHYSWPLGSSCILHSISVDFLYVVQSISSRILQSTTEVFQYIILFYLYITVDLWSFPAHYNWHLKSSCVLKSNSEVFLYTAVNFWGLPIYYSQHLSYSCKLDLCGLPVCYSRPLEPFCILQSTTEPFSALQSTSEIFLYDTVGLWGFPVYYTRPLWISNILQSMSSGIL